MHGLVLSSAHETKYPGVFQDLKLLIGEGHTAKLVEQHGGTRLYIPATLKIGHSLGLLLGQKTAQLLADKFGGLTVEIPLNRAMQITQRNKLILADRASGMPVRETALKYHMTERHIRSITNSPGNTNT